MQNRKFVCSLMLIFVFKSTMALFSYFDSVHTNMKMLAIPITLKKKQKNMCFLRKQKGGNFPQAKI